MISGVIIVAHSNDIIRKGLGAIIRNIAGIRVVEQNTLSSLNINIKDVLAIVIEPSMVSIFNNLGGICAKSRPKGIIVSDKPNIGFEDNSLSMIHLGLMADEIVGIIKNSVSKFKVQNPIISENELSVREIDVLKCVALGMSNKEIADKLFISIHTAITHRKNITAKLGIKSTSGLTIYAIMEGFIEPSKIDIRK